MLTQVQRRLLATANVPNTTVRSSSPTPLQGGSISSVVRLDNWVIKSIDAAHPPSIVTAEVAGLKALSSVGCLTPEICAHDKDGLLLKYYPPVAPTADQYAAFATSLASLHQRRLPAYQSERPRFLGTLALNSFEAHTDWTQTFVHHRLRPLLNQAIAKDSKIKRIDLACLNSGSLFAEGPCLIHGDLWTGNILPTDLGLMMIDPSCWVGERGIDLAMLRLFGEMPSIFWHTYQTLYPIPTELERMISIYQLYYALAHVAMFGATYTPLCEQLWDDFHSGQT